MKNNFAIIIAILLVFALPKSSTAQKNSGIFYTTILAKTAPYKRIGGFGKQADYFFLKDVNGDGKDDAVTYSVTGKWEVALSNGTLFTDPKLYLSYTASTIAKLKPVMGDVNGDGKDDAIFFDPEQGIWSVALSDGQKFGTPANWSIGNGAGSTRQFLADVNGDGADDAIIYFHTGLVGYWYVGLSNKTNGFGGFSPWISGFGETADEHFLADVDGDGKADAVFYEKSSGKWNVAISTGTGFANKGTWKTGFGVAAQNGFVYDVDRDGKADVIYCKDYEWWVCYSNGTAFDPGSNHRWVTGNRPATIISRGNKPAPKALLMGSVSGSTAVSCAISLDDWFCLDNPDKGKTVEAPLVDTWDAWGNVYTPVQGTYDAGDPAILDAQIKMIHDAGFTYVMLDITNGNNPWVDTRAIKMIERIVNWNGNLGAGKHKMFFCISMGTSRSLAGRAAADRVEYESKRTWDEFYEDYKDAYYNQDGKPFLVHFVEYPANRADVLSFLSSMPYFQKFTVRWMFNEVKDEPEYQNTYGWPLLTKDATPTGKEVMCVSPGFWNGGFGVGREQGELYRSQWARALELNPASIWLNSFNESWEHTSVEPAHMDPAAAAAKPDLLTVWTDYYGDRMDDFYWVMTKQYNRLFMNNELFRGCYLQEKQSSEIYVVKAGVIEKYGVAKPRMAPVLLVPKGFIARFSGNVIDETLQVVGSIAATFVDPSKDLKVASNVLTPNGDGKNDFWLVKDIDKYPNNVVRVFDKAGKKVFEKKGYDNTWGGRYWGGSKNGNLLPAEVYLYVIDYGDGTAVKKGYLTILNAR